MHESLNRDQLYVTVDILILTVRDGKLVLMLSRRPAPPYEGCMSLPGRLVGQEEHAETTVRQLLKEMLPVPDPYIEQLYSFSEVNRDPRGRVISIAYLVIVTQQRLEAVLAEKKTVMQPFVVSLGPEGLRLTGPDGGMLIGSDLGFDHGRIIETGIQRLRGKIDYTDIGFRFINNLSAFSLSELQTVFEAVLDTSLDRSNFRRSILTRYEKTGRLWQTAADSRSGRGRPAVMYRFDL